jgi:hypothetical protein
MKGSLKLRPRRAISRSEAWACFTANLALPGSGSLAAGRAVGYFQLAAAFFALIFSLVSAIPMYQWAGSGGMAAAQSSLDDPYGRLSEVWRHVRWPLMGVGLFAASILWGMITSLVILAGAGKDSVPPSVK